MKLHNAVLLIACIISLLSSNYVQALCLGCDPERYYEINFGIGYKSSSFAQYAYSYSWYADAETGTGKQEYDASTHTLRICKTDSLSFENSSTTQSRSVWRFTTAAGWSNCDVSKKATVLKKPSKDWYYPKNNYITFDKTGTYYYADKARCKSGIKIKVIVQDC